MNIERKIYIDALYPDEKRIVVLKNGEIESFDYEIASKKQVVGNIYLARVTSVEKSLQAAFVEFLSTGKQGFLPFYEIHPSYFGVKKDEKLHFINYCFDLRFL